MTRFKQETRFLAVLLALGIIWGTALVVKSEEKEKGAGGSPKTNATELEKKQMDTETNVPSMETDEGQEKKVKRFVYNPSKKRDPFRSLILKRAASAAPIQTVAAGPICEDHIRSPLEAWDLPILRLEGVLVLDDQDWFGMIGAPDGRGYSVRVNHYVGRNCGQVSEILPNRIIIREQWRRSRGNIDTLTHTLKLRPEEE